MAVAGGMPAAAAGATTAGAYHLLLTTIRVFTPHLSYFKASFTTTESDHVNCRVKPQVKRNIREHGVALQVAFERQTLKPVFHLIGYRLWV
jgi:hypothetical protein